MGMSDMYGPTDRSESIATIHAAIDQGITLLDTGDFYGMGHNEMLVGEALKGRKRDQVQISVKFGALRGPDQQWLGYDARPAAVRNFLAYTLNRLGVDYIDIYRPARLDPNVPIEDTVGAIGDLIKQGYVRYVGLSEVSAQTIRRAQAVHPISDLQIEYSLISRGIEKDILPTCRELGIGITAYGVLSRGLISGHWTKDRDNALISVPARRASRVRISMPTWRWLRSCAPSRIGSVCQWRKWRSPGSTRRPLPAKPRSFRSSELDVVIVSTESLGALKVSLSADDLAEIERAIPA